VKSKDIRRGFLEYFRSKGHEIVRSSSLIPKNDPTLLFTNAGMVQFKGVFLGEEKRPYSRAVTCQKCMRAGGKHSDIENVGHTRRHHTFFEMLGNFSFGDYFKKEAIGFAWELLTGHFGLPKERLYVSIYEEDDEAGNLWKEVAGLPEDRIVRLGAKDNFWQMADTGPCGPCSEIIIDQGVEAGCGRAECKVGCDCDRYLELWNLVFMQYNRDESGRLSPLPRPSIDTGMGLERIASVLQGVPSNFDTDLFRGIISEIERLTPGSSYSGQMVPSYRVIADHIRAVVFLMADGLMPSNEGRGYVLRRIIRRASRHARVLGVHEPMLYRVVDSVVETFGEVYPELTEDPERTKKILLVEEERFSRTLEQGISLLDGIIKNALKSRTKKIPGEEVFRLYDTYGFPFDLAKDMAHDSGLEIDERGFHEAMEAQRERARASWVGEEEAIAPIYRELLAEIGRTEFLGYESLKSESIIRAIIKDGQIVKELNEADEAEIIVDRTPFYGESGGQVGDTGVGYGEGVRVEIIDTKKPIDGLITHIVRVKRGRLSVWQRLSLEVDEKRRLCTMRNHTATHLLHSALRAVLGEHVKQAGSLVEPERLRFDFTHFDSLKDTELSMIEDLVNEKILMDIPVSARQMDIKEALSEGAIALFGEKYGERVRVIKIENTSTELCGGTHVRATGQIGLFKILSEGSVASGIRRIEAITGLESLEYLRKRERELKEIGLALKTDTPLKKIPQLLEELKELRRAEERLKSAQAKDLAGEIVAGAELVDGIKVASKIVKDIEQKDLRALADVVKERLGSGIVVLASVKGDEATFLSMVNPDISDRYRADKILKGVASITGGRGGGKAELAQGGTKSIELIEDALKRLPEIIRGS